MVNIARDHNVKTIAWEVLLLLIAAGAIHAVMFRRRGTLAQPALVPIAVLAFFAVQFVATPLSTSVSRRYEAEADWKGLQATRDPDSTITVLQSLTEGNDAPPSRPAWARAFFDTHPDPAQRVAMALAWARMNEPGEK